MNKIEEALGTVKSDKETWKEAFARVDKTRGLDHKTLTKVIISIVEELYDRENNELTNGYNTTGDYTTEDAGTKGLAETDTEFQEGLREVEEEIQTGLPDTSEPIHSGPDEPLIV